MRELTAGTSEDGQSSTLVVRRAPVVERLRAVMSALNSFVIHNSESDLVRFAFLMQALTDEVIEELEEVNEATIEALMMQMGEAIAWIGHGDTNRLPEPLRAFAEELESTTVVA